MIYDTLANYYDSLVKDEKASLMWKDWIEAKIKPCDVLELACGSGEITYMLSEDGYQVSALDLSKEMIERAKVKDPKQKIRFYVQDMLDLSNFDSFSAILCLCDSFNYILDKEQVDHFFYEVSQHLNKDGYFFFDTHSLDRMEEFKEEFNETGSLKDCDYQWSIMAEEDLIYQDFAFYLENGEVIQEHHIQRVYEPVFLEETLSKYFNIIQISTDFELEGIAPGEKYFYICQRK